ncbi:MAG: hypothetical protein HZC28_17340 [Spirochaetes bacterium]|nr:hypothetical protein [Spirochaetota bacterium]
MTKQGEALAAAQKVIKGLSADTRYILQMHEDGYTSSEIAETVHKPEGTVQSICSSIRKAIRAAYENVMKLGEHGALVTERSRSAAPCTINDVPAEASYERTGSLGCRTREHAHLSVLTRGRNTSALPAPARSCSP